jgi:hypothetical protein
MKIQLREARVRRRALVPALGIIYLVAEDVAYALPFARAWRRTKFGALALIATVVVKYLEI